MRGVTREEIEHILSGLVDEWDGEDAGHLLDILLEAYTVEQAYTWIFFFNHELGGTPLMLLEIGRARQVFAVARRMTAEASRPTPRSR